MSKNKWAPFLAFLAAFFYALNTPFSKLLLNELSPTYMAAFLYLGAGVGIGLLSIFRKEKVNNLLEKNDFPFVVAMVVLDIIAPILLMLGLKKSTVGNTSLLGNFEIVATTFIAYLFFKEKVSNYLKIAICFIVVASCVLSLSNDSFIFSMGSIYTILATCCWGLENNCTRSISNKNVFQIVTIKGFFSGLGSLVVSLTIKDSFPNFKYILITMVLGFVAYGLSIFVYVLAQRSLGAAKTAAYYAFAPFLAVLLAFVINREPLSINFYFGLLLMIIGTYFVIKDTLGE